MSQSRFERIKEQLPTAQWVMLAIFAVVFIWSGAFPHDRLTWFLEGAPVIIGLLVVILTHSRLRLTTFTYGWILFCAILVLIGAHYTYPLVPIGEWLKALTGGDRNNYDKIGHFFQGCCPAIIGRELLIRRSPLKRGFWLFLLVVAIATTVSAWYEIGEWFIGALYGGEANSFLGAQGYQWDTQSDMLLASIGAVLVQLTTKRLHDRSIKRLEATEALTK